MAKVIARAPEQGLELVQCMQAHPSMPCSKLGIAQEALDKVTDSDAPSDLFCFDCPTKLALREAVLRVQRGTAAALASSGCGAYPAQL
jgi:hypothetical protein